MNRLLARIVAKTVAWLSAPFCAQPHRSASPLPTADGLATPILTAPGASPQSDQLCLEPSRPSASGGLGLPTPRPTSASTLPTPRDYRLTVADTLPRAAQAKPTLTDNHLSVTQAIGDHSTHRQPRPEDLAALEQRIRSIPLFSPQRCHLLALAFTDWLHLFAMSGSDRTWTVDDVWFLASEDFGPAFDVAMPPRQLFLTALGRLSGVHRRHHVRRRIDGQNRKTTIYWFIPEHQQVSAVQRRHA